MVKRETPGLDCQDTVLAGKTEKLSDEVDLSS